jgi:hypothetical protein
MWSTIRLWVTGKNAVAFERERRTTLLEVPQALHDGGRIYDRRADGSVLEITVPMTEPRGVIMGHSVRRHSDAETVASLTASRPAALPRPEES